MIKFIKKYNTIIFIEVASHLFLLFIGATAILRVLIDIEVILVLFALFVIYIVGGILKYLRNATLKSLNRTEHSPELIEFEKSQLHMNILEHERLHFNTNTGNDRLEEL